MGASVIAIGVPLLYSKERAMQSSTAPRKDRLKKGVLLGFVFVYYLRCYIRVFRVCH